METPKTEHNKSDNDSATVDNDSAESNETKGTGRKLLDAILSKNSNRKPYHDRRIKHSDRRSGRDRRTNTDNNYDGPVSRFTIDRRLSLKDRRNKG